MYTYKKYLSLIREGLIITHNIQLYKSSLEIELNSLNIEYNIDIISKYQFDLEILNSIDVKNDTLIHVVEWITHLFGYYPSYVWLENKLGKKNYFKYNEKYVSNSYAKIKIRFEAKYNDKSYKNDIVVPNMAYHLTPQKNKENILRNGLIPKRKNRKSTHPDRIYFFYNLNNYNILLDSLKQSDYMNGDVFDYLLLEVKLSEDNIIHTNPNYINGVFTYDNINPKNIKILQENL
jgi:hypothetical protein